MRINIIVSLFVFFCAVSLHADDGYVVKVVYKGSDPKPLFSNDFEEGHKETSVLEETVSTLIAENDETNVKAFYSVTLQFVEDLVVDKVMEDGSYHVVGEVKEVNALSSKGADVEQIREKIKKTFDPDNAGFSYTVNADGYSFCSDIVKTKKDIANTFSSKDILDVLKRYPRKPQEDVGAGAVWEYSIPIKLESGFAMTVSGTCRMLELREDSYDVVCHEYGKADSGMRVKSDKNPEKEKMMNVDGELALHSNKTIYAGRIVGDEKTVFDLRLHFYNETASDEESSEKPVDIYIKFQNISKS
ncbi:hypothetical protein Dacet_2089 [Denitrovibrio acetiphilus DSM 12809]|uniref:Uncharacterized protein n=1 Tax=Denitrovibrio acetiphilus (strain DSM 12809 / NBRC 114555 / N2460) TaxID=522772 RepID=D4H261_DENA2|nr:hypothetical protein [Denitrovibrio acetiphilus]ADD68852.1 hypothetical protein Dacet_2089 [Denitrovibrio acetiphilus DSM 12809]